MQTLIVLDLEWNQSPKGKEGAVEGIPFEIIEIGAVKLDAQLNRLSTFHYLIRPQVYRQIHYKISEVIHTDMEKLNRQGVPFPQAMEELMQWCGSDYMFCTWGSMDLTELQRNVDYYHMNITFSRPLFYFDVQKLYNLLYQTTKERLPLDQAAQKLGIEPSGTFHQALDDACFTSKILQKIDFERVKNFYSVDYYHVPQSKEEAVYLSFPGYIKYVSREFADREMVMQDKNVTDMICDRCSRLLRKKIRWFSGNQKIYHCLAICPEHGYLKGKIRIKKSEKGGYFAVKTIKGVEEGTARKLFDRRDEAARKRNAKNRMRRAARKQQKQEVQ